ncbi:MAG: hypothetical protein AAGA99_01705 [Actinomycetota bacterium]
MTEQPITDTTPNRRPRRVRRTLLGGAVATAVLLGACGGDSDSDTSEAGIRSFIVDGIVAEGIPRDDAECIADGAFAEHDLDELATFASDTPDPAVLESVTRITTDCLLNGGGIADLLDDDVDAAAETVPAETTQSSTTEQPIGGEEPPATTESSSADAVVVSSPAFCGASLAVAEAFIVGNELPADAGPRAVEGFFSTVIDRTEAAIRVAPNASLAEAPQAFLVAFRELDRAAAAVGYAESLSADPALRDEVETIETIAGLMEEYLVDVCEVPASAIPGDAAGLAAELLALDAAPTPVDTRAVVDDLSDITVTVPGTWFDQRSSNADGARVLVVAPDVAGYDNSWAADGVKITAIDVAESPDLVAAIGLTAASSECTFVDAEPYNDGAYYGVLNRYNDCGSGTEAIVISATNTPEDVLILVELQMQDFDEAVLQDVISSFLI